VAVLCVDFFWALSPGARISVFPRWLCELDQRPRCTVLERAEVSAVCMCALIALLCAVRPAAHCALGGRIRAHVGCRAVPAVVVRPPLQQAARSGAEGGGGQVLCCCTIPCALGATVAKGFWLCLPSPFGGGVSRLCLCTVLQCVLFLPCNLGH